MNTYYLELKIKGERFCVYPPMRLPAELWRFFPIRARKCLPPLLSFLNFFSIDRLFLRAVKDDFDFIYQSIRKFFPGQDCWVAYAWPSRKRSKHRFYGWVFNRDSVLGFLKIVDSPDEKLNLTKEVDNLLNVSAVKRPFCYPRCLLFKDLCNGVAYGMFSPIPRDAVQPAYDENSWRDYLACIAKDISEATCRILCRDEALTIPWVQIFLEVSSETGRQAFLHSIAHGMRVARVHGDFSFQNVMSASDGYWVFDWEEMDESGPCLIDELLMRLGISVFHCHMEVLKAFDDLRDDFIQRGFGFCDIIQALAFMRAKKSFFWEDVDMFMSRCNL